MSRVLQELRGDPLPPIPLDDVMKMALELRKDPAAWMQFAWDWGHGELDGEEGPRAWQLDIAGIIRDHLNSKAWRQPLMIAVSSGHGIGKTAEMGMLANWAMSTCADAKVVVTANTDTQLRTKTSPEIGTWFRRSVTATWFDVQAQSIVSLDKKHSKTWRTDFVPWSAHNTEAFAGLHNRRKRILLCFDEASKIDDKVWEVAEGALTDKDTEIIWIVFGNPTQITGRFRECFRKYRHRWIHRQIDSRTVPGTNLELFERWKQDHGEDSDFFKVRVRGIFPTTGARQFINGAAVDAAFGRHLRPEQYNFAPVVLGVDPAWTGDDEFVIVKRQGLASWVLGTYAKNDDDVLMANIIRNFELEHKADATMVDGGFGTGIVSALKNMGSTAELVWFSGASPDAGCLNMRAYMWDQLNRWLVVDAGSIPNDEVLRTDLVSPELVPRLDGKKQLESKEDMKQRGVPSPNRADALALTFARPVIKREIYTGALQDNTDRVQVEYNIFG